MLAIIQGLYVMRKDVGIEEEYEEIQESIPAAENRKAVYGSQNSQPRRTVASGQRTVNRTPAAGQGTVRKTQAAQNAPVRKTNSPVTKNISNTSSGIKKTGYIPGEETEELERKIWKETENSLNR